MAPIFISVYLAKDIPKPAAILSTTRNKQDHVFLVQPLSSELLMAQVYSTNNRDVPIIEMFG